MAFLGAITPGPDILLVLQTTLKSGLKRALLTLAGIASGWIIYLIILYIGFAQILQSDIAQILLSAFGAIYLAYLAYLLFTKHNNAVDFINESESSKPNNTSHLQSDSGGYLKGLIINLSNPKAIIFFSVIVAPFMDKNLLMNLVVLFCGLLSAFFIVIALGLCARKYITNKLFDIIDKVCAVVFLAFSAILLWRIISKVLQ